MNPTKYRKGDRYEIIRSFPISANELIVLPNSGTSEENFPNSCFFIALSQGLRHLMDLNFSVKNLRDILSFTGSGPLDLSSKEGAIVGERLFIFLEEMQIGIAFFFMKENNKLNIELMHRRRDNQTIQFIPIFNYGRSANRAGDHFELILNFPKIKLDNRMTLSKWNILLQNLISK